MQAAAAIDQLIATGDTALGAGQALGQSQLATRGDPMRSQTLLDVYNSINSAVAGRETLLHTSGRLDAAQAQHLVQVDASVREAMFSVSWTGSAQPRIVLIRPDGATLNSLAAGRPGIGYFAGTGYRTFRITAPEPLPDGGGITAAESGLVPATTAPTYTLRVSARSSLKLRFSIAQTAPGTALPIPILVSLTDTGAVRGATVRATLASADGERTVVLLDDGVYGESVPGIERAGNYVVRVQAEGTHNGIVALPLITR